MQLTTDIYRLTQNFPKHEIFGLTSQIGRSAVSIPSNIAEGYGRNSTQDYVRFLRIACGTLYELQSQLEISSNLNYLSEPDFNQLFESTREIERMLSSLISKIETRIDLCSFCLCACVPY